MSEQEPAKVQAKEKMLEALFEYAAACHVENILIENLIENSSNTDLSPTLEFERKMKKWIGRHNSKDTLIKIRKRTFKFLPQVAIFLLVILGSLTMAVASVEAFRIKVLNMFLEINDQYTEIKIKENDPSKIVPEPQLPSNWNGYVPGYIPKGFITVRTEEDKVSKIIEYTNESGQMMRFTQYENIKTDLRIDTENAIVHNITIHNSQALLVEKEGLVSIVWQDQILFCITGEIEKSEIIKMAKNIRK
ncbi:MAG: DUF4367 domain-containing protein [Desulfitobacterium hafniense]|nr:DUF4367 domain-containing protein [Desulfitobacterium hafniense]